METSPDFKTRMEILAKECKAAEKFTTTEERLGFIKRHPILSALGFLIIGGEYVWRVVVWVLIAACFILGLKCCWLAVGWLWRLI